MRIRTPSRAKRLVEPYKETEYVVQNPPALPLTTEEMDAVYDLPYARTWHPSYDAEGGVPAIQEVRFSLVSNRGCFGGCSFCALTFHQGRRVQVRSHESILREAEQMSREPDFKGYIHDVGAPRQISGIRPAKSRSKRASAVTGSAFSRSPVRILTVATAITFPY